MMAPPLPPPPKPKPLPLINYKRPLIGMLPEKYKDTDVQELFPEFRQNQVLRFSRLFGIKQVHFCVITTRGRIFCVTKNTWANFCVKILLFSSLIGRKSGKVSKSGNPGRNRRRRRKTRKRTKAKRARRIKTPKRKIRKR